MSLKKENQNAGQDDRQEENESSRPTAQTGAAPYNQSEADNVNAASRAAVPSYELDEENKKKKQNDEENRPLTTQGSSDEAEENLGGTTNLSLEQLKNEGDPEGSDVR